MLTSVDTGVFVWAAGAVAAADEGVAGRVDTVIAQSSRTRVIIHATKALKWFASTPSFRKMLIPRTFSAQTVCVEP